MIGCEKQTLWINNENEKRDMILYLNAIKIEMEENLTIVKEVLLKIDNKR